MKVSHHQHRIIREKGEGNRVGSNGNLLEPILQHHAPHKSHLVPQVQTRNPQYTPGLFPRIDTSSDRDQLTNLQQRIKDLEKENFRLAHHVQQAEHSLRNYREILAAYNININQVIPKPGGGGHNVPLQIPPRPQELELEKKYHYATKQIEELLAEKLKLSFSLAERSAECSNQNRQLDEERQRHSQLQQQLMMTKEQHNKSSAEAACQIEEILKENEGLKMRLQQQQQQPKPSPTIHNNNLQPLLVELKSLRKNEQALRSVFTHEMQAMNVFVNQSLQELKSVAMFAQRELNCKRQELVAAKVDKELAVLTMQQQIDILQSRLLQFESSKPRTPVKVKTSPKKPDNDRLIQHHEAQIKQQEECITSFQSQLSDLQSELSSSQESLTNTLKRFEKATSALHGLQEVHCAEVKAIKHLAHVRELLRVAKEREAGLERDRLAIEIKHLK